MRKLPGNISKMLKIATVIVLVAACGWLAQANAQLRSELARSEAKAGQLKQKFVDQRRQAESLLRLKAEQDGRVGAAQIEAEQARAAGKQALAQARTRTDEVAARLKSSQRQIDEVRGAISLKERGLAQSQTERQKLEAELDSARKTAKKLEGELAASREQVAQERAKNAKLCEIAGDLVVKYKQKGVGGVIVQNEPLTQVGRVTLERLTREYSDKITENRSGNSR